MSNRQKEIVPDDHALFDRVVSILEQARGNVVRAVNSNMVMAYWLIGREIVMALQGGDQRAEYGKQVLDTLSIRLTEHYGKGFSVTNLKYFRLFYQAYPGRLGIRHTTGDESEKSHPSGDEFGQLSISTSAGKEAPQGFSPNLSWSHYRELMRVKDAKARDFYEQESIDCGWSKAQLERQIQTAYYERIIANRGESGLIPRNRERLQGDQISPSHLIKSPMVLEFLGLPDSPALRENTLEQAIIDNLQAFLLELGKGFSFVARQRHIRFDDEDFYIDLVFYNYILKCFLLIDLKIGKLTHRDVGQMDGYVRLYEDQFKVPGDNPTIGLILCSGKSEAVARYSVLNEGKQIFASKYLQFLPTEEQLKLEIERERKLIEVAMLERKEIGGGE